MPSSLTVVFVSLLLAAPAVISWLWLVIVPVRVTKLCPEECWCDIGGYVLDCSNKALHNIPSIYFTQVQELVLNDNNKTSLEKYSFISKGLTQLYKLALDRCGLQKIELGAFSGLTELTVLSMRENGIEEITRRTFENISVQEYIDSKYNEIEHLDVDVFSGLINLQHIYLDGNRLLKLHPDIFVGFPKLQSLVLRANRGLRIPTDRHFITSHSLKFLDISDCSVSSVSVETFANVSALETLDLNSNDLISIDINILKLLPKLSVLYLYENPIQCDCQLKEVLRWCQEYNIETEVVKTDENHWSVFKWKENCWGLEELQCVQNNISNREEYKQDYNKHPVVVKKETSIIIVVGLILLYILISIFGTIGNVIILIIIMCNKDMRTLPNMYILNLAISDLIFLTLPLANFAVYSLVRMRVNQEDWCTFFTFCYRMSVGLSAYSLAVLSIRRYIVIVEPVHDRVSSKPTWCVTVATICGVWIVAALFAIPSALSKFVCVGDIMELRNITYQKRVFTFELLVFCVLPLFVIAFFYIMAVRHLVKDAELISEETQNPQLNKSKNVAKYVMGLIVFLISYVPYHVFWACIYFNSDLENRPFRFNIFHLIKDVPLLSLISYCVFLINSSLNPVALFCTSSLFRKHLKRYLCRCCKTNSLSTDIELRRRN